MAGVAMLLRFFRVVPPVPPLLVGTLVVATTAVAIVVVMAPSRGADALGPVLTLQLFAAASGFAVPARRGHYDALLTRTGGRWQVAVAHWLVSIAPGVAAWLVIGTVEIIASRGASQTTLVSGTVVAMVVVSTIPWALNIELPRFASAIGWLLLLVTIAAIVPLPAALPVAQRTSMQSLLVPPLLVLVYPLVIVGETLEGPSLMAAVPAIALCSAAMVAACIRVARSSIPLEAAQ